MDLRFHLLLFLVPAIFLLPNSTKADDAKDQLLNGINRYRTSLNLSALAENENADCLADEMANQFKNQDCSNTTGADTVPGTEEQFSNYPQLLDHCHLNISVTRGGVIMPACVPNLETSLVLSNFTQSQYSQYLNDSLYIGAGIASEDNWIVVVLTANTPNGSFSPAEANSNVAGPVPKADFHCHFFSSLLAFFMVLMS